MARPTSTSPSPGQSNPRAQAAAPREVKSATDLPEIPAKAPDAVAVMAFENHAGVRALDWGVAGVPLTIGEKLEHVVGLVPTWGPWVVPEGPVVVATPATVAALAASAAPAGW